MEQSGAYKTERLIPESQIRDAIKEILAEMLGVNATAQNQRQWYDTDPAYSRLDLDSAEQLREMTRNETLRIGIEVRDVRSPNSQLPRYQFHIEKCEARLLQRPEKRQGKKTA
ncbi:MULTISPECIES: hypothetical protein [unclassified Nostoc]|uniref:hypothetical protein n=1 Tax=unclassified Nostoc TaxID=2593658 RepID=UPI002AD34C9A|nr:hypothetical protein [Nostoc sp. DedQUE04]MDZ8138207.1 hypothetical protein [Nostoc sp. DedQUE04]